MILIATATPLERIDDIWWLIAWAGLILSSALGILTLAMSMIPRCSKLIAIWLAAIGGAIALYPILFVFHIYRIDFVAVGGDGTPASPPILAVMAWPSLPFLFCLMAGGVAHLRRNSPAVNQ